MATTEWVNEQLGQLQVDTTANMEAMAEKMATKTEVQEERTATKEWVNEQLGQHVDAERSALKEMCKEGQTQLKALQTTVEKKFTIFDERLGHVIEQTRIATAAQDAAVAQLRSEHGQTSGQIGKLSAAGKDVDAKLAAVEAQVKTAQTTVVKMTTIDGQPVDVRDVSAKLQLLQVKNPHDFDVFVYLSRVNAIGAGDMQLVLFDGSLVGQPARKAVNWIWSCSNVGWVPKDEAGLRQLVRQRLARNGLEGARWTRVTGTTVWWLVKDSTCSKDAFPTDSEQWRSLDFFQEFLRRSGTRITQADVDRGNNSMQEYRTQPQLTLKFLN